MSVSDDDSIQFKGAAKKFYKLFSMPTEEKLVNCMYILNISSIYPISLFCNMFMDKVYVKTTAVEL